MKSTITPCWRNRVTTTDLKPGVNVFPDEPPTVLADIEIPGSGIQLTIKDAQGK